MGVMGRQAGGTCSGSETAVGLLEVCRRNRDSIAAMKPPTVPQPTASPMGQENGPADEISKGANARPNRPPRIPSHAA